MANNQEFYCNHCKKETLFFLESDLLWYCDECGNVLNSTVDDDMELEFEEYEDMAKLPVIRCPFCNSLVRIDEVENGRYCPICYEDLLEEINEVLEKNED